MPHRIFIVEDHEWVREMLARLLALQTDLEVCGAAEDPEAALDALPAGADVVLVDLALGSHSGLDLVGAIRERWPHIHCIVLSGKPAVEHAAAARDAGAAAFVEKGDAVSLLATLSDVLDLPKGP
ncbi:MAG: response regulator, partial [Rhodothermales bacterium]|nr:response regulator [Rhodothermales bacterium]